MAAKKQKKLTRDDVRIETTSLRIYDERRRFLGRAWQAAPPSWEWLCGRGSAMVLGVARSRNAATAAVIRAENARRKREH